MKIFQQERGRDPRSQDPWISDLQTTGGRGVAFLPQRFCTDGRVGEVFFFLRFFFFEQTSTFLVTYDVYEYGRMLLLYDIVYDIRW